LNPGGRDFENLLLVSKDYCAVTHGISVSESFALDELAPVTNNECWSIKPRRWSYPDPVSSLIKTFVETSWLSASLE